MAAALALLATVSGCGGGSADSVSSGSTPTPAGMLEIAMARSPSTFDPLLAASASDRLVTAQIYEPLTRRVAGPYGDTSRQPGLVVAARPSEHQTVWQLRLRPGVRFSDGALLDASAVLRNATRWRAVPQGQRLLPGLMAADAPRPDVVRLIFDAPRPNLVRELDSPQLGVVSPRALGSPGSRLAVARAAGTGAFVLQRQTRHEILLARNQGWWGTRHDLGPGVQLVDLRFAADPERRLALLRGGTVQIAEDLEPRQIAELRTDPLLTVQPGAGERRLGVQRSVRGFAPAASAPALSRTWLTTVGTGGR